ncbi:hypothetical protein NQ318_001363 [Aromia moschata]|uniref:DUF4817 domain-containing protein n=1 Tax=Aromia moschata TaxID=1265417 RepID=A0AAV8YUS8_9CUCU|nr:hypothetical protein NQ318_001363 [Aromia moschata]
MHKITILQMIGYGDRTRTQAEVVRLFQEKYPELPPISQGTVSKIEKQQGTWTWLKKNPPNKLSDDQKLDRIFKQNRILPFKPKLRDTLEEGDEAKRLDFCLELGNRVLNDRRNQDIAQWGKLYTIKIAT